MLVPTFGRIARATRNRRHEIATLVILSNDLKLKLGHYPIVRCLDNRNTLLYTQGIL